MEVKKYFTNKSFIETISNDYSGFEYDSNKIEENYIFLALNGVSTKGSKYIEMAINKGAKLILTEDLEEDYLKYEKYNIPIFVIENLREKMGKIFFDKLDIDLNKIKIIGITGTNGKTTTSYILREFFENSTLIGTNGYIIKDKKYEAKNTTPESVDLAKFINQSINSNVDTLIMEVSSHSLKLKRVNEIKYDYVIFTNLSQDHLDFHKDMEDYFNSKQKIFDKLKENSYISINLDNEYTKKLVDKYKNDSLEKKYNILTFSTKDINANYYGEIIEINNYGMKVSIYENQKFSIDINIPLIGRYNLENVLSSISILRQNNIEFKEIKNKLENMKKVKGRAEIVENNEGKTIIIDFAHTDDGLKNILKTLNEIKKNKIITVFGCGGDRDSKKRPKMGKVATELSDFVIITNDNPRSEDPNKIIEDIEKGIERNNYIKIENRSEAIKFAITNSTKNDIILIAGKGHEEYQIIKDKVYHFSDLEEVQKILKDREV